MYFYKAFALVFNNFSNFHNFNSAWTRSSECGLIIVSFIILTFHGIALFRFFGGQIYQALSSQDFLTVGYYFETILRPQRLPPSIFRGNIPDLTNKGMAWALLSKNYINLRARFCNIVILYRFELAASPHALSP